MHSLRCLRIMQMRTIIILGFLSLSITFLLLIFHTQIHDHYDSARMPTRAADRSVIRHNNNVIIPGRDEEQILQLGRKHAAKPALQNKDQFVFNAGREDGGLNEDEDYHEIPYSYASDTRPLLAVPRILKYCNLPHSQAQGHEGLVSLGYKLLSVQVVIRHGDRSPIYRLPQNQVGELSCLVDTMQFVHLPKIVAYPQVMAAAANKAPHSKSFYSTCGEGQLTGQGAIQHIINGMHLSERYLHQHQLFSGFNWFNEILIHTTETSRTYQSALAFIYGFVPEFDITKVNVRTSPLVNFCEDNVFGVACQCPGLDSLRTKSDGECKLNKEVQKNNLEFKRLLGYVSKVMGISPNSIPGPSSLMDGLAGMTCHSHPLPCNSNGTCITAKVVEQTWRILDAKTKCQGSNPSYNKYCRAIMHGLLFRIARNFKASSVNGTNAKFHLYSGHDTTVNPLIVALGISDNVWPGYAHRIVMELYAGANGKRHFIRVLQNGKVVTDEVIFCRGRTDDDGLCDFEHFLQYVKRKDLKAFCSSLQSSGTKHMEF